MPFRASSPAAPTKFTPADESMMKSLANADVFRQAESSDGDEYGRTLSAFEVVQQLEAGQPVVMTHPHLGSFEKARFPEDSGRWYVGTNVKPSIRDAVFRDAATNHVDREGTLVGSALEMRRYTEANGFTSATPDLSPEEAAAAGTLRKYQGGITGKFITVYTDDDFNNGYYFQTKADHSDENPGLYNPNAKEGLLGYFGNQDRLTPYDAMELLNDKKPVHLVNARGQGVTLNSFEELAAYDRLR